MNFMKRYDLFKKHFSSFAKCLLITHICKHRKLVIMITPLVCKDTVEHCNCKATSKTEHSHVQ